MRPTRRLILKAILAVPPAMLLHTGPVGAQGAQPFLSLTPSCGDDRETTPAQTEGPFFRASAPLKRDLRADAPNGAPITLAGFVVDTSCQPVPGALFEIWHADETGVYDNSGFRLRGHQFTDGAGRWGFNTIVPARYSGRTPHYHVKVQPRGGRVLTTQLYFPDNPRNARDGIFDPRLVLQMSGGGGSRIGRFDFVV